MREKKATSFREHLPVKKASKGQRNLLMRKKGRGRPKNAGEACSMVCGKESANRAKGRADRAARRLQLLREVGGAGARGAQDGAICWCLNAYVAS